MSLSLSQDILEGYILVQIGSSTSIKQRVTLWRQADFLTSLMQKGILGVPTSADQFSASIVSAHIKLVHADGFVYCCNKVKVHPWVVCAGSHHAPVAMFQPPQIESRAIIQTGIHDANTTHPSESSAVIPAQPGVFSLLTGQYVLEIR